MLDENFPDPDVLQVGDTWYAYATQKASPNSNLQEATSKDLKTWQLLDTDPLPRGSPAGRRRAAPGLRT